MLMEKKNTGLQLGCSSKVAAENIFGDNFVYKLGKICCYQPTLPIYLLVFSHPVMSDSLQSHGLQHTRPPCPSPSPEVCPSSCPLHWWCHPAISSSDAVFSFCPQSFPASGTFPVSCPLTSDVQNTGASASVIPVNIQGCSPLRLNSLISLLSKGLLGVFSSTTVQKHQFFGILPFFTVQLSQP